MKKNVITLVLLFGAGLGLVAGCDDQGNTASTVNVTSNKLAAIQELVRGNGTEVTTLDPHKVEGVPAAHVLRDLLEGLMIEDGDGNTILGSAESWESTDKKHYTFKIRKDAKWSNGDPLTAHDFEYSFKRVVDPKTASPYAWYIEMTEIKNAKDIVLGKKPVSSLGVKAIDEKTLEIETEIVLPHFIKMLAHTTMSPAHRPTVEKYGADWTKPEYYVSNGAYRLSEWVVNEKIELVRNETYWNNANTTINKVTFLPIENSNAELNRYISGEIDITASFPTEHYKRLKKERPNEMVITPNLCTYYYGFNNEKAPFDDVKVRTALSYAIDRQIITNAVLGQGQIPAYGLTHSGVTGFKGVQPDYAKMTQQERNEKAKALLLESGFSDEKPLSFSLLYNTNDGLKKIAVAIQSMWKKTFGDMVSAELVNQEWKTFLDTRRQGNFDVTSSAWCADYNEASSFLAISMTGNGNNDPRYSNAIYDKAMFDAARADSESERNEFYVEAEAQLAKDMPIAPIYEYVKGTLISTKVAGFPYKNPQNNIYTKNLSLLE